ncbi:hypothetical protein HZP59_09150 [Elizabethkingia anophelis]|nr:hypothetical protein [Elizabethkingia anophelis]
MQNNQLEITKKLNSAVALVTSSDTLAGFERAYQYSLAISQLKDLLTPEYMNVITSLQGSRLGFLTDKDKNGGYDIDIVKNCIVDAVLTGVEIFGNQFNIIGGNMYPTKEGFNYLLKKIPGLSYDITYKNTVISSDKQSANMTAIIDWKFNKEKHTEEKTFNIKSNQYASVDSLTGKCERKAKRWLYERITGNNLPEADAEDVEVEIIKSEKIEVKEDDVLIARVKSGLTKINNVEDLNKFYKGIQEPTDTINDLFKQKKEELNAAKTSKPNK